MPMPLTCTLCSVNPLGGDGLSEHAAGWAAGAGPAWAAAAGTAIPIAAATASGSSTLSRRSAIGAGGFDDDGGHGAGVGDQGQVPGVDLGDVRACPLGHGQLLGGRDDV